MQNIFLVGYKAKLQQNLFSNSKIIRNKFSISLANSKQKLQNL